MDIVYLDWAASAIPDEEIIDAVSNINRFFFGNPSSRHLPGNQAMDIIERARVDIASIIGCPSPEVFFTSGGTESNNTILHSIIGKKRKNGIVCSTIEHASLYEPALQAKHTGHSVSFAGTGEKGFIDPDQVYDSVDEQTGLVTCMLVNNETGAVQPLKEICSAVRQRESEFGTPIHIHTDAVQALGKIPFSISHFDIDSAAFSAHKLGGPKGVGALFSRKHLSPLLSGGGQENALRSGTENTPGIHGFSLAVKKRAEKLTETLEKAALIRNRLTEAISSSRMGKVLGHDVSGYSPFILTAFFPPVPGEVLARVMNDRGYAVSTGSACSSRKKKKTRVLEHMGISPEDAGTALRISIGHSTGIDDIDSFCATLFSEVETLRKVAG